jgi:hypothetical protein
LQGFYEKAIKPVFDAASAKIEKKITLKNQELRELNKKRTILDEYSKTYSQDLKAIENKE